MSGDHQAMVFDAAGLSSSEKLLLLAYTRHTDAHGYCYPGMARLQHMTGLSESTIKRTRKSLEAKNLLRHQRRTTKAGDATSNVYRVNLDKLGKLHPGKTKLAFDDDLMAELDFADDPTDTNTQVPNTPSDLQIVHGEPTSTGWGHHERRGGVTMAPPRGHHGPTPGSPWPPNSVSESEGEDPDPDARARDGRTGEISSEVTDEYRDQADAVVQRLDLKKLDAKPKQKRQIRDAIAAALARGVLFDAVLRHAEAKLQEANTCKYFRDGFGPDYLPVDASPARTSSEAAEQLIDIPDVRAWVDQQRQHPEKVLRESGRIALVHSEKERRALLAYGVSSIYTKVASNGHNGAEIA